MFCRALSDPHVWGEGADSTFRVRPLQEYEKPLATGKVLTREQGPSSPKSVRKIRSVDDVSSVEILILEFQTQKPLGIV